jgi:hypothetical protein
LLIDRLCHVHILRRWWRGRLLHCLLTYHRWVWRRPVVGWIATADQ